MELHGGGLAQWSSPVLHEAELPLLGDHLRGFLGSVEVGHPHPLGQAGGRGVQLVG